MEKDTIYAYKLQHIENPTFDNVQRLARTFINDLPQPMVDEIYEDLNRGVDQLTTEPQMLVYLHAFGSMHQAKLRYAFDHLPDAFLQQPEIRIVDYGCGQAIGTMCYADFLADRGLSQTIKSVTLIEPSEICLKRAALHVSQFCPDAKIHTVCKPFDDLTDNDLANPEDIPTLHILSNVLDIQQFDLEDLATLIANNLSNYNQFVCVGPYFNYSDKDERMTRFAKLLNGNVTYSKIFEKGELCEGKTWTAQIMCFVVVLNKEKCSTKTTNLNNENSIKDESGVVYGLGKRLLKCNNKNLKIYEIINGTEIICREAFKDCLLEQITIPNSVKIIETGAFSNCKLLKKVTIYSYNASINISSFLGCDALQFNEYNNAYYLGSEKNPYIYLIKAKTKSIFSCVINSNCSVIAASAFSNCEYLRDIYIPQSITKIGGGAFFRCRNLELITIPDTNIDFGVWVFTLCDKLIIKCLGYSHISYKDGWNCERPINDEYKIQKSNIDTDKLLDFVKSYTDLVRETRKKWWFK